MRARRSPRAAPAPFFAGLKRLARRAPLGAARPWPVRIDPVLAFIATARGLVVKGGHPALTTNAVAARAKISKRSLYETFESVDDLFAAVVRDHSHEMIAEPPANDDLPLDEAIAMIFRVAIDGERDASRHAFLRVPMTDTERFPQAYAALVTHGIDPSRRRLATWLARQARAGWIRDDDPDRLARQLMDLLMALSVFRPGSRKEWPDRAAPLRWCIRMVLDGLRPRPASAASAG